VDNGVVLGQIKTEDKSNEITAIPELLKLLDISGSIVSIDAMGCQESIAKTIHSKGADYVLAVKKNQKNLHEEISDYFTIAREYDFKKVSHEYYEEHYKGHGRVESRRYWLTDDLQCISKKERWAGLKTIGMAESERHIDGEVTIERRYFITSLNDNAQDFGSAVRKHWAIENSLHWVLDVTFKEDNSRARRDNAAENLAVMRHIALNTIKNDKTVKVGVKAKRYRAALMPDYTEKLLNDIF
jgi:predicted transposase YbfD/YdcC